MLVSTGILLINLIYYILYLIINVLLPRTLSLRLRQRLGTIDGVPNSICAMNCTVLEFGFKCLLIMLSWYWLIIINYLVYYPSSIRMDKRLYNSSFTYYLSILILLFKFYLSMDLFPMSPDISLYFRPLNS